MPFAAGVGEVRGVDDGAVGAGQVDLRVRRAGRGEFGRDGLRRRPPVGDDEDPQVHAGRRVVRPGGDARQDEPGQERARGEQDGAGCPLHAMVSPPGAGVSTAPRSDAPPHAAPASPSKAGRPRIRRVTSWGIRGDFVVLLRNVTQNHGPARRRRRGFRAAPGARQPAGRVPSGGLLHGYGGGARRRGAAGARRRGRRRRVRAGSRSVAGSGPRCVPRARRRTRQAQRTRVSGV